MNYYPIVKRCILVEDYMWTCKGKARVRCGVRRLRSALKKEKDGMTN